MKILPASGKLLGIQSKLQVLDVTFQESMHVMYDGCISCMPVLEQKRSILRTRNSRFVYGHAIWIFNRKANQEEKGVEKEMRNFEVGSS